MRLRSPCLSGHSVEPVIMMCIVSVKSEGAEAGGLTQSTPVVSRSRITQLCECLQLMSGIDRSKYQPRHGEVGGWSEESEARSEVFWRRAPRVQAELDIDYYRVWRAIGMGKYVTQANMKTVLLMDSS